MRVHPVLRAAAVVVASGGLAVACAGTDTTGDQSLLNFDQQDAGAFGATTVPTTIPPAVTTVPAVVDTTPVTTAPPETVATTVPPEQQVVSIDVSMTDNSPYFEPSDIVVPVGGRVRFINNGTAARRVVADNGAFDSGDIAPGAVYILEATVTGQYTFTDGRPFAGGRVTIQ